MSYTTSDQTWPNFNYTGTEIVVGFYDHRLCDHILST